MDKSVLESRERVKHLGLFEGIGGFSLAARWMGWETVAWVEINPFCQKVLNKNFPEAKGYGDIKEFDGTPYRGTIDIITGGFPCQPFSLAGQREGTNDDRYLWPEMLRVISEVKPSFVVGENVAGIESIFQYDLSSEVEGKKYNSKQEAEADFKGVRERTGTGVLYLVLDGLKELGYHVEPFNISAACVGAEHRRERVWIIAYSNDILHETKMVIGNDPTKTERSEGGDKEKRKAVFREWFRSELTASGLSIAHPDSQGLQKRQILSRMETEEDGEPEWQISSVRDGRFTEPAICGKDHGIPDRVDRIKALGNAIVPQVALEIFKAIEAVNKQS